MTDEESVAIVLEVKDMAIALRAARDQRDKLRDALRELADEYQYRLSTDDAWQEARAALAEMEDGA